MKRTLCPVVLGVDAGQLNIGGANLNVLAELDKYLVDVGPGQGGLLAISTVDAIAKLIKRIDPTHKIWVPIRGAYFNACYLWGAHGR